MMTKHNKKTENIPIDIHPVLKKNILLYLILSYDVAVIQWITSCHKNRMTTGWRPVVAAYQWWPFAFCKGNYVFVASQNLQLCKRKQKESP